MSLKNQFIIFSLFVERKGRRKNSIFCILELIYRYVIYLYFSSKHSLFFSSLADCFKTTMKFRTLIRTICLLIFLLQSSLSSPLFEDMTSKTKSNSSSMFYFNNLFIDILTKDSTAREQVNACPTLMISTLNFSFLQTIMNDELDSQKISQRHTHGKTRAKPRLLKYDVILRQWALRHPNQQ